MKKLIILAAAAVILIPLGMWWFSPEQIIIRRTKHLMEVLTIGESTGRPFRQAKVFSMNAMLAPEISISISEISDANGTFDKQEVESAFSWICQNAKRSEMSIIDFGDITITDDEAEVEVMVDALFELPAGHSVSGNYVMTVDWVKTGDGWRFEKVVFEKK